MAASLSWTADHRPGWSRQSPSSGPAATRRAS